MSGRARGEKIGDRYEIRRLLGVGGMGEVYEASASNAAGITRRVAVKVLLPDPTGGGDTSSFREEARVASRLHHGGIVGVLDYGEVDGNAFLVLEMVDGLSTSEAGRRARARGETVPSAVALAIVVDVARALHHAHTLVDDVGRPLGIVHRDVKPSNVLLSWVGDVKLGDFGIALAADRRATHTTGAFAKGTPGYMAPEQLLGGRVEPRTDVFALGCTLHAILTGASPLRTQDDIARLLSGAPLALDPRLDPDVAAIVARATSTEPARRHESALAFAEDAAQALSGRLRRDPRGEISAWLANLRDPGARAPAPLEPPRLATRTILSGEAATDTFAEPAPRESARRPFVLAMAATLGLGLTFVLGVSAATWWSRAHRARATEPLSPDASALPVLVEIDAAPDGGAPVDVALPDPTPDAATDGGAPAPPRTPARPASPTYPRPIVPGWVNDRRSCAATRCAYAFESAPGARTTDTVCRRITRPFCHCWTLPPAPLGDILCRTPYRADKTCPSRDPVPGETGEPCRGWTYPATDGPPVDGKLRCSRCEDTFGPGVQGTPCKGIHRDGTTAGTGYLQCMD